MPPSRFARYAVPVSIVVFALAVGALLLRRLRRRARDQASASSRSSLGVLFLFVSVAMVASRVVRPLAFVARRSRRALRRHGREPRAAERGPEPGQDRLDGRGGDDRARADHLRRRRSARASAARSRSAVNQLFVADYALTAGFEPVSSRGRRVARERRPASRPSRRSAAARPSVDGDAIHVTGVDANLTKVVDDDLDERRQQRSRRTRRRRRLRHRPLRRGQRPHAVGSPVTAEDADRCDAAAPGRRDLRRAEGRLARSAAASRSRRRRSTPPSRAARTT